MTFHRSSIATISQAMYDTLEEKGVDADELFTRCGIDPNLRFDSEARFPVYATNRLWQAAIYKTRNPSLIYEVVAKIKPQMLHAMGHAWIVSRSLLDALKRFVRYHRILSTNVAVSLEEAQGSYQLVVNVIDPMESLSSDGILAFTLHMCREAYGKDLAPLQVQLTRLEPRDDSVIEKFFGCDIEYGAIDNVIIFNPTDLNRKLRGANASVANALDNVTVEYLSNLDANDVVTKVRKYVAETLMHGEPSKQDIALELSMSTRTLQRRLDEEGTSTKEIIDETRHHLALTFIAQPQYSIKEVAYGLGFSDPSNFARAFKRWTGKTPRQFRKE